ncbi:MAG: hypothetical protein F6K35_40275, partial [Okeania sp. SIO2H7]|nr:hypothetical protein [Okeania sp. SIO2H7]
MPRKRKPKPISAQSQYEQLSLFDLLENESYEVLSRDEVANYNPVQKTANYMKQLVESQQAWETTIQTAREQLLKTDARQLYFDFLKDLKDRIEQDSSKSVLLARLLKQVAIRGLGMTREQVQVDSPPKGSSRWKVNFDEESIQQHLQSHIVGEHFLNEITADETVWGDRTIII